MINSTLGGSIKDYRLQKGLSQLDIAFSLGWKEPSRLSRIEQGKTEKPPREQIDKIIEAMGLMEEEKNSLLLTGGYLPTDIEIKKILSDIRPTLEQWPYPAVIIDFTWRLIDHNNHFIKVAQVPPQFARDVYKSKLRILDMLFNFPPENELNDILIKNGQGDELHRFLRDVILNFKFAQRSRTKEKWYIDHVKSLMANKSFRDIWVETSTKQKGIGIVGNYVIKKFFSPDKNKILSFYMFVLPFLNDPRFEVELLVPMDQETYKFYQ